MSFDAMLENDLNNVFFNNEYFAINVIFTLGLITHNINCIFDETTEGVDTFGNLIQFNPTITASTKKIKDINLNGKWTITVNSKDYKIKSIQYKDDLTSTIELTSNRL